MRKILLGILLAIVGIVSISCGNSSAPAAAAASSTNPLPEPSINCGGNDCL